MPRISLFLFPALLLGCCFFMWTSIAPLPENVAIHFDANGAPNGWVARERYRILMVLFLVGLPLLLVGTMAGLPKLTGAKARIPHRDYWLADERRAATESFLLGHACWLGCIIAATIYGIHLFIARANAATPPVLGILPLVIMIFVFICCLAWWTLTLIRRFQRAEGQ